MKSQKKSNSMRRTMAKAILAGAVAFAAFGAVAPVAAQATRPAVTVVSEGIGADGKVRLVVNRSQLLTTKGHKRVNVAQPEIADVNLISPTALLVTAKKPGTTQLIIWDDNEKAQVVEVFVDFDLIALNDALKTAFPGSKIEATAANGSIMLRGRAPNLQAAEQAAALAAPYGAQGGKVLNFLEVAGGQQVMLQVRFAEVSRAATTELGFNLAATDGVFSTVVGLGTVEGATMSFAGEAGSTAFDTFITALRSNNLLRVLAEPNLVAISGQEASFLAGGEFPVPVPQDSSGGSTTITIEYKEFGVALKFVPVVLGDGKIRLRCMPEVSDLDFTNAVTLSGFRIPALTKRQVQTTVELKEGQTLALAGLLNSRVQSNTDVTPLLGDIPVLGALFRSVRYERRETELMVLVTPRLVGGLNPDQVPSVPGEKWRYPTEGELFWLKDLGSELPADKKPAYGPKPARFQGNFGFQPVEGSATPAPAAAKPAASTVTPAKASATSVQPTTKATGK